MSQVDNLLNSLSAEDVGTYSVEATEPHIIIGNDRRVIIPDALKRLGVEHDHNIETVTFDCPRYWDKHDMSKMQIYINYSLSNGYSDAYLAENIVVEDEIMHFDWTISKNVTQIKGPVSFNVCVKKVDEQGNESNHWNSEVCREAYISEGLETVEQVVSDKSDLITQLLDRMDTVEDVAVTTEVSEANANTARLASTEAVAAANTAQEAKSEVEEAVTILGNSFSNPIRKTVSGEVIRMDDVSPVDHTVRAKVGGKNLARFTHSNESLTVAGVIFTKQSDGTVMVSGTATNTAYFLMQVGTNYADQIPIPKGVYTLSTAPGAGCRIAIGVRTDENAERSLFSSTQINPTQIEVTNDTTRFDIILCVDTGFTVDNVIFKPQIEFGTEATEYEPYIDPATVTITKFRKNLLDVRTNYSETVNGVTFTFDENGKCTINGTNESDAWTSVAAKIVDSAFYISKGATVTVSGINCDNATYSMRLFTDKTTGNTIGGLQGDFYNTHTVTLTEDTLLKTAFVRVAPNATINNAVVAPIVEIGSTASEYEPYIAETYTPATDGSVDIPAVAPTMTICTNTTGANIEAEYNRDSNVVVDEIHTKLDDILARVIALEQA